MKPKAKKLFNKCQLSMWIKVIAVTCPSQRMKADLILCMNRDLSNDMASASVTDTINARKY